jgi:hypothetical protein
MVKGYASFLLLKQNYKNLGGDVMLFKRLIQILLIVFFSSMVVVAQEEEKKEEPKLG